MDFRQEIEETMQEALNALVQASIEELTQQGHVASGRGIASFETVMTPAGVNVLEGQVWGEDYLIFLDTGTKPHTPPFAAIYKWVKQVHSGPEEESVSFAWAVVSSIKKYGTPSPGSYEFSKNGRRLEWSKFASQVAQGEITRIFEGSQWVEFMLDEVIRQNAT